MVEKKVPIRLEKRTISGKGLFKLSPDKNIRILFLYLQVVRLPRINFTNSKYNPDKSEYAKITWLRKDYVLKEQALHFEQELITWEQDSVAYLAYANVCMYNSVIAYLDYVCTSNGKPPLARTGLIYVEPVQNLPDAIKIVCRDDTAIIADLWRYDYDLACPEADSDSPPPPDPPPADKVPPGVSIGDISPPYDGGNDGSDTSPNPSDDVTPPVDPPQGTPCATISIQWEWTSIADVVTQVSTILYAPYYSIYVQRQGTPGIDYSEQVILVVAQQQIENCNSGLTENYPTGVVATMPNIKSATFLGITEI